MVNILNRVNQGFEKFQSLIPIYGVFGAIKQVGRNILLIETVYRFEKTLNNPEDKFLPIIPLELATLSGAESFDSWVYCDAIRSIRGEFGLNQFRERLANGYILFYASANHKLAGFMWLSSWPVQRAGYNLKSDEGYTMDGWVFTDYRGVGVLPTLKQFVFDYVRTTLPEKKILIGHVATWNKPCINAQHKAGSILVARELSVTFLGFHCKYRLKTIPFIKCAVPQN